MAIGHEQMEVERAALAPGVQEYGWIGVPSRVGGWAQAGGGGSFLHAYRQENIITSTGSERTLLSLHTYRYGILSAEG
jgi:hypothetical protein